MEQLWANIFDHFCLNTCNAILLPSEYRLVKNYARFSIQNFKLRFIWKYIPTKIISQLPIILSIQPIIPYYSQNLYIAIILVKLEA